MGGFLKSLWNFFITIGLLGVLLIAGAAYYGAQVFNASGPIPENTVFDVSQGANARSIATDLYANGLIKDKNIFMIGARYYGYDRALKAGEYELEAQASMHDILKSFAEGNTVQRQFTIPEGLTSYEIIRIIKAVENMTGEVSQLPAEGSLLPDTYSFERGEDRNAAVKRMKNAMVETIEELWPKRVADLPFDTKEEALTLASIVEKETAVDAERKRVAGVFINRLRQGIPLQTDPTVIYAITKGKHENEGQGPLGRRLLKKDLSFDSPYNTYKYGGLPPGPIANPGRASIEAVLNPEEHDYIYFVADGTGGHIFAKTLKEHNNNVANWRKIRREQEKSN